ncbi:hypothetical protein EAY64_05515 [Aquitalea palustris]|uniref:HNH endonuclease n=2 Tax=Aquitalea palustris TaxID=2480983 RepID=A0A454JKY4_9NEIS|nr:hypothetical protein EAY64_05515 [Aquitalea palustris]
MQSGEVQKLSRRNRTHGMAHSREYKSWEKMRERCSNSNTKAWQWYGGKGIRVCQPWQDSFEAFYRDMGPRPEGCEIDRIDPSGNYEPLNCRWLPRLENGLRAFRKDKVSANG